MKRIPEIRRIVRNMDNEEWSVIWSNIDSLNLHRAVKLPPRISKESWIAVRTRIVRRALEAICNVPPEE